MMVHFHTVGISSLTFWEEIKLLFGRIAPI